MCRTTVLTAAAAAFVLLLAGCGGDDPPTTSRCADATGDGGSADLTGVVLEDQGGDLAATFSLAGPPPNLTSGTFLLSIMAWSEAGDQGRQLGIKWIDGTVGVFSFDAVAVHNQDLDVRPTVDGNTVSVVFPEDVIQDLGDSWTWRAGSSVDGADVDDCPDAGDDPLNPVSVTFG